jgi:phosphate:Na+ symporter
MSVEQGLDQLRDCTRTLGEFSRVHRTETFGAVANGTLTAGDAVVRVDVVRILEALTHHAWR